MTAIFLTFPDSVFLSLLLAGPSLSCVSIVALLINFYFITSRLILTVGSCPEWESWWGQLPFSNWLPIIYSECVWAILGFSRCQTCQMFCCFPLPSFVQTPIATRASNSGLLPPTCTLRLAVKNLSRVLHLNLSLGFSFAINQAAPSGFMWGFRKMPKNILTPSSSQN